MSETKHQWMVKCSELRSDPMTLEQATALKKHWDKTAACKKVHEVVLARPRSTKKKT